MIRRNGPAVPVLLLVGVLLGSAGPGARAAEPSGGRLAAPDHAASGSVPIPSTGLRLGVVEDTIDTTSGGLSLGNDLNTSNLLGPQTIAYDPTNGRLFVAHDPYTDGGLGPGDVGGVAVLNASTGAVIGNIVYGNQPDDVLYDPDNGYVYAVDWRSSQVLVIDPNTDTVVASIATGDTTSPVAIALDPHNDHLFVTESAGGVVLVINGSSNETVGTLVGPVYPWWDVYDPANGDVYVEDGVGTNVSVFNGTTGATVASVPVTNSSTIGLGGPMVYAPSDQDVYVPVAEGPAVVLGPTNRIVATLPTPSDASGFWGFAYDPYDDGGVVLGTEWNRNVVQVIPATPDPSIVATRPVGAFAMGAVVAGSPAEAYVACWQSDNLTRFNASDLTPVAPLRMGTTPEAEAYDPHTGTMDVALSDADEVLPVNIATEALDAPMAVGSDPDALAFDPVNGWVYVANFDSNNVSILNTTGAVGAAPVGDLPSAVAVDTASGDVYVASYLNSTLTVLSGDSVVGTFPIGNDSVPTALVYDPNTSSLFVVNSNWGNVSEYDPSSGALEGSFPVGDYPISGTLDPSNGELYVANFFSDNVSVTSAVGLAPDPNPPVGDYPSVLAYDPANGLVYVANSYDDDVSVISPANDSDVGTLLVGEQPYGIAAAAPLGALYVANRISGTISVVVTNASEVPVQFAEYGLPIGDRWSVDFLGSTLNSTGPVITFYAPNGTAPYAVSGPGGYAAYPAAGSVTVAGMGLLEPIQFLSSGVPAYPVEFAETGLASGTEWGVTVNAVHLTTDSPGLTFYEPNGSYDYAVDVVPGFPASGPSGFQVLGAPTSVDIRFGPFVYPVTLTETGLPPGRSWGVVLGGSPLDGSSVDLVAELQNGSYPVSVEPIAGFVGAISEAVIEVRGSGTNLTVSFSATPATTTAPRGVTAPVVIALAIVGLVVAVGAVELMQRRRRRRSEDPPDGPKW